MNILVGDVGGTHCRLAMARVSGTKVTLSDIRHFRNEEFTGLAVILAQYLGQASPLEVACLAVAGPTDGRHVQFTNLSWHIDAASLEKGLGLKHVGLVNDFSAVGWGLNALGSQDLTTLQEGIPGTEGVKAAVGAGTGLGVSIGIPRDGLHHPIPTEGGHIGFAPLNPEQDRLLDFLRSHYGRVSVERLLSGPGIIDLYRFCAGEAGQNGFGVLDEPIPAQAISVSAQSGQDAAAVHAMKLFAAIYGQVAGDIALLTQARGGIYLAGGIPPKILPLLRGPEFLAGFHAKGRFSDWMHTVPVAVVLDDAIGLRGAAVAAIQPRSEGQANTQG
ncbi:MAG: glucokinase [Thiobacillus sp.]|nr:glucokinase [Thiobacillus sp.]